MGKKGKEKKNRRDRGIGKAAWASGLIALAGIGWLGWRQLAPDRSATLAPAGSVSTSGYARREKGTPLSPALFVGKTAAAYQVAQEIPEVLDQLYCYCECDRHMRHITLLSCFVDSHAATWVTYCQNEALEASQMIKQGYSVAQIRQHIDAKYSRM